MSATRKEGKGGGRAVPLFVLVSCVGCDSDNMLRTGLGIVKSRDSTYPVANKRDLLQRTIKWYRD